MPLNLILKGYSYPFYFVKAKIIIVHIFDIDIKNPNTTHSPKPAHNVKGRTRFLIG